MNGTLVLSATDSTFLTGQPGIGFFHVSSNIADGQTHEVGAGADGELAIAPGQTVDDPGPGRMRVGLFSLRQIVGGDQRRAAGGLSISYGTLRAKMKRYGISPPALR
ncbi:MAG TPA: hypothetical protein VJ971_02075 [Methylomirabilota bacterium]|nr:hypothetical protein [Methylomirabilota bacterium]